MRIILGPQGEPIEDELFVDGEQTTGVKQCSSFLKRGTDFAALRGPQGEILLIEAEDGELALEPEDKCPTCGQDFPDSDFWLAPTEDDRDDISELSA